MAKASNKETARRVDTLQELTLKGHSNTACVQYARQEWGLSRPQSYRLLKRAWEQTHADIETVNISRQELVAWSIAQLQQATGIAMDQKNIGAVVGAIRELDHLCGLGNHHPRGSHGLSFRGRR